MYFVMGIISVIECDLFVMAGRIIGHAAIHGGPALYGV